MPGLAAVGRDLHAGHHAAAGVGGGARDRDLAAVLKFAAAAGEAIVEVGGVVSVDGRRGRQARTAASWAALPCPRTGSPSPAACSGQAWSRLGGPVLPHALVSSSPHAHCTVPAPNTSAPLGARYSVRWWVAVPVPGGAAVVGERLDPADRRRGQVELSGGTQAVVGIDVPLVAERACPSPASGSARRQLADRGVSPEPELAVLRGHRDVAATRVDEELLAGQGVRRVPPVCRRAEAGIGPRSRPGGWILRIGRRVEVGLLVGGQRPVGSIRAVLAGTPPRLPEDLVAAEEREVDARRRAPP